MYLRVRHRQIIMQCCGSGSKLGPWIQMRAWIPDPESGFESAKSKMAEKKDKRRFHVFQKIKDFSWRPGNPLRRSWKNYVAFYSGTGS
jgi:hypothetical protein